MRAHLATLLDDFRRDGGDVAVVRYQGNRRRVSTYGEIASLAGRFAALLVHRGIVSGDRVLIWAENSAEWIAAFHGCMLRGVLAVPLDATGTADFAARVAADVNPALAIGDAVLVSQLPPGTPRMAFEDWPTLLPCEEATAIPTLSVDTPVEILFTSGTTGDPKGIVLTHGNVLASFSPIEKASQPYLKYERPFHPLRILHTLPLSHVFGQTMGLWVPSIYRAQLHFENHLVAARLIDTVRRERISVLAAVPRVHALLRTHLESTLPGLAERIAASKAAKTNAAKGTTPPAAMTGKIAAVVRRWWRFRDVHRAFGFKFWALISGGGALPGPLEAFWNAVGLVVVQGYGMTESTALITLNHPFHVAQGTIGKPLAGREVKLGPDGEVLVRGASISQATWSGGKLRPRASEWLATGDLAEAESTGELRFVGRKSEVIVTAAGVNLHPEDLEAAVESEPGVAACAVVPFDTPAGPEPLAVLALRQQNTQPAAVIERANAHLAEFQRLRRWVVWPEPDLPRTSTGKVRRKAVAARVSQLQSAAFVGSRVPAGRRPVNENGNHNDNGHHASTSLNGSASAGLEFKADTHSDWLLNLLSQISGENPAVVSDDLRLTEDFHLDSLGRVQLAAALEERAGISSENALLDGAETVGDLRRIVAQRESSLSPGFPDLERATRESATSNNSTSQSPIPFRAPSFPLVSAERVGNRKSLMDGAYQHPSFTPRAPYRYPHWPWSPAFRWLRVAFVEAVMRPLVRLLGNPRVVAQTVLENVEPMLIVANHVTSFDGPLLEYALPTAIRRHIAVAMSGEMLDDYRHFRNPNRTAGKSRFFLPGPLFYYLLTAFFNVFPLPRRRDIQRSFAHAGDALDAGMHVLLFPEGARSADGRLASFRPGIGMLVKQSNAQVLPMAIRGVGDLKSGNKAWFRSGQVEVRVGTPMKFSPHEREAGITAQLQAAVEQLLRP